MLPEIGRRVKNPIGIDTRGLVWTCGWNGEGRWSLSFGIKRHFNVGIIHQDDFEIALLTNPDSIGKIKINWPIPRREGF
jgi:hypothetical protein